MFGWIKSFVSGARRSSARVVAELDGLADDLSALRLSLRKAAGLKSSEPPKALPAPAEGEAAEGRKKKAAG
jgi:hypothetical protein